MCWGMGWSASRAKDGLTGIEHMRENAHETKHIAFPGDMAQRPIQSMRADILIHIQHHQYHSLHCHRFRMQPQSCTRILHSNIRRGHFRSTKTFQYPGQFPGYLSFYLTPIPIGITRRHPCSHTIPQPLQTSGEFSHSWKPQSPSAATIRKRRLLRHSTLLLQVERSYGRGCRKKSPLCVSAGHAKAEASSRPCGELSGEARAGAECALQTVSREISGHIEYPMLPGYPHHQ